MNDQRFRILSLDGGGVRGYLTVSILEKIEEYLNVHCASQMHIGRRFDLISGTSIGGILALGLALGYSARDLRGKLYDLIPKVFGQKSRRDQLTALCNPKYNSECLEEEVQALFGSKTLDDLETDVCVTSLSLIDAKPRLHKTDYFSRNMGRIATKLVDVAMATAAAPTYFKAHSSEYSANLVDGGLIANNPSVIALIDACQFQRASKRGVQPPTLHPDSARTPLLLSVGTGKLGPLPYDYKCMVNGGLMQWARPIHEVILLGQSQLVDFQIKFLLNAIGGGYLRINPTLNVPIKLDDAVGFGDLRNKADVDSECEQFLNQNF